MSPKPPTAPQYNTVEESREVFDRAARRYLTMSAEEFIALYDAGEFDTDPCRPEVAQVAMLVRRAL